MEETIKQKKVGIIERLEDCIYADFDMEAAELALIEITDENNLDEIDNAIVIINSFLNGDYNDG